MYSLIAALTAASVALAAVSPTSPSGDTVVRVGQPLNALWTTDGTGQWTDTVVQLMTGDNFQVLSTGIDGTKDTEASWTTPNVTPNSKIYFLQFTQGGNVSTATWTTRFTIASADGSTTPPTNTTSGIQWGIGQLVGEDGQPIPNPTTGNVDVVAGGGSAGTSNSTASSVGAGVSSATQGSGPATISVTTSATGAAASASTTEEASASSASTSASSTPTGSASTTRAANANATSTGAAGKLVVGGWTAAVAGLVGVTLI